MIYISQNWEVRQLCKLLLRKGKQRGHSCWWALELWKFGEDEKAMMTKWGNPDPHLLLLYCSIRLRNRSPQQESARGQVSISGVRTRQYSSSAQLPQLFMDNPHSSTHTYSQYRPVLTKWSYGMAWWGHAYDLVAFSSLILPLICTNVKWHCFAHPATAQQLP